MGKATRWFKALLGLKRSDPPPRQPDPPPLKPNRRWSFVKSYREKSSLPPPTSDDASKHAIVVAAASAAAAEAAVAAAQAAAEVVRLTTSGRRAAAPPAHVSIRGAREASAAVVIQSQFRGYLARRALKALKGLVKLQALVRGRVVRKKTAETMRCIQAMLRAQARARSIRAYDSPISSGKSSHIHHHHYNHPGPITPEKFELKVHTSSLPSTRGVGSRLGFSPLAHHDKIVEIDTGKPPRLAPPRRRRSLIESKPLDFGSDQLSQSFTTTISKENSTVPSSASCEVQSSRRLNPPNLSPDDDDGVFCDASATSCFSGHSECPSYMADTESSRARTRSLSAPRQRPRQCDYERASSTKRWTAHQRVDSSLSSAAMRTSFVSRAYPGSGHLDRLGMPVRSGGLVYYSGCLN